MKKVLLFFMAVPLMMAAMGQSQESKPKTELRLVKSLYYDRGVHIAEKSEKDKLYDLITEMIVDTTLHIHVIGYADKWGGKDLNDRFSYTRAVSLANWIRSYGINAAQIEYVGGGVDIKAVSDAKARRVDIFRVIPMVVLPKAAHFTKPKEDVATEPKSAPAKAPEVAPTPAPTSTPTPAPAVESKPSGDERTSALNLRTNLLYDISGMLNVGVEYRGLDSNWGVLLGAGYSFFGNDDWAHSLGGWFVSPEVRYYIPSNDRWFVGVKGICGGYNTKLSDTGYQGTLLGGGVMGGYRVTLTDTFDMDFTLGAGCMSLEYDTYYHSRGVNVLDQSGVEATKILPIEVGVNLIWKIK